MERLKVSGKADTVAETSAKSMERRNLGKKEQDGRQGKEYEPVFKEAEKTCYRPSGHPAVVAIRAKLGHKL